MKEYLKLIYDCINFKWYAEQGLENCFAWNLIFSLSCLNIEKMAKWKRWKKQVDTSFYIVSLMDYAPDIFWLKIQFSAHISQSNADTAYACVTTVWYYVWKNEKDFKKSENYVLEILSLFSTPKGDLKSRFHASFSPESRPEIAWNSCSSHIYPITLDPRWMYHAITQLFSSNSRSNALKYVK